MHVKGLNLPMEVENVLDDCIEPPGHERVIAAINMLERVGALDMNKNLTSLGNVLLHLPVEAAIGKFCLLGCFFRCLGESMLLRLASVSTAC
jgi:HrpA-like RNA helicase